MPTLYEYYTGQGQALPSVQERSKIYEQYGLGSASLYAGTAEQNTALLGKLQSGTPAQPEAKIGKSVASDNAIPTAGQAEIKTDGAPPISTSTVGSVVASGTGASATGQSTLDQLQKTIDALATQKPSAETETVKKSWLDAITKRQEATAEQKSATELREEAIQQAYKEMGITPEQIQRIGGLMGEISAYNQQLADIETRKQAALDAVEDRPGMDLAFQGGEMNRISKAYNRELSAKALAAGVKVQEMQMLQGAYSDAKATASQLVELATYDQQQRLADIEWSINAYQDVYNLLSQEEQTVWDRQYTTAQDELGRARAEATNVSNLMLEYPKAGITITDTVEQATQKASQWQAIAGTGLTSTIVGGFEVLKDSQGNVVQTRVADGAGTTGGTTAGFSNTNIESSIREDAVDLIYNQGKTPEEAFKQLRTLYSQTEASDEAINSLLGITPQPTTETTATQQSDIENRIAQLKRVKGFTDADVRAELRKEYSSQEINASSVGQLLPKIGDTLTNFFFGKK